MASDIIERLKASILSIASALSSTLTIYPCQIRVHQSINQSINLYLNQAKAHTYRHTHAITHAQNTNADSLNSNFLQLRRSGGRPQRAVHSVRLPVNTVIHTTLVGLEPAVSSRFAETRFAETHFAEIRG